MRPGAAMRASSAARIFTVGSYPSGRIDRVLSWIFTGSCFLPYLALPIGSNTSIPATALLGLMLLARISSVRALPVLVFVLTGGAVVIAFGQLLLGGEFAPVALISWFSIVGMLVGAAATAIFLSARLVSGLSILVLVSCLLALVQKFFFLDRGVLPLLMYYSTPGYASVASQETVITTYIRRPFGLFPEPSFLAGSTALALAAIAIVASAYRLFLPGISYVALIVGAVTIFFTGSGSSAFTLVSVCLLFLLPTVRKNWTAILLVPVGAVLAVMASVLVVSDRVGSSANWSWADRPASMFAGLNILLAEWNHLLLGVGRGLATVLMQTGEYYIGVEGYVNPLSDIASAFLRIVVELGLLFGGGFLVYLAVQILTRRGLEGSFERLLVLLVWLSVGGFTITYDQAAFLWFVPGISIGLNLMRDLLNRDAGERLERAAHRQ